MTENASGFRRTRNLRERGNDRYGDDRDRDETEQTNEDRRNEFARLNPKFGTVKAVDEAQNDAMT